MEKTSANLHVDSLQNVPIRHMKSNYGMSNPKPEASW